MKKDFSIYKRGQAVIMSVLFFIVLSGVLIAGVSVPAANQIKSANEAYKARQSYLAADSANDDALYRLNQGWTLPSTFVLPFSDNVTSAATVTTNAEGAIEISVVGDSGVPSRASKSVVSSGAGISLNYTAQIGTGGIEMQGTINGSVYSNGNITMTANPAVITGSATVGSNYDPVLDQTNSDSTVYDVDFGKTSALQDIAQGFQVSSATQISIIRVYLKKTGAVGNITLRIVSNSGSNPGGTTLASQTINASNVASSFGYVPVTLSSPVSLTPGVQYWLVLDYGSNHASKYYTTKVTNNTYGNGVAKAGSWTSGGGTWNAVTPSAGDMVFDVYLGGSMNKITGQDANNRIKIGTGSVGNGWAFTVNNANIAGSLYCINNTATYNLPGSVAKSCVNQSSAPIIDYPISNTDINEWKDVITDATDAISGGWTYGGSLTVNYLGTTTSSLKRINGNLTLQCNNNKPATFSDLYVTGNIVVESDCTAVFGNLKVGGSFKVSSGSVTIGISKIGTFVEVAGGSDLHLKGNMWAASYIKVEGGSSIALDSSLGSQDGAAITDGRIEIAGGSGFQGTGVTGGYIVGISLADCPGNCSGGSEAVKMEGASGAIVVFAPNGTVLVTGGASLKQVMAEKLKIQNGTVTYEPELTDINFETGPSSGWVVESWDEVGQ